MDHILIQKCPKYDLKIKILKTEKNTHRDSPKLYVSRVLAQLKLRIRIALTQDYPQIYRKNLILFHCTKKEINSFLKITDQFLCYLY